VQAEQWGEKMGTRNAESARYSPRHYSSSHTHCRGELAGSSWKIVFNGYNGSNPNSLSLPIALSRRRDRCFAIEAIPASIGTSSQPDEDESERDFVRGGVNSQRLNELPQGMAGGSLLIIDNHVSF